MGIFSSVLSIIDKLLDKDWSKINISRDYRFENYKKHVTVYRNGDSIIIVTFRIKVFKPEKVENIYRRLGIQDGKITSNFPKLNEMKSANIDDRFHNFGFWFISDDDIVTKAKEYYWTEDDYDNVDYAAKSDSKEMRWKFIINDGKLKKGQEYVITYVLSVPGMFPIENGFYYKDLHDPKYENYKFCSSMKVDHVIRKLTYVVSFENGIELDEMPRCTVCDPKKGNKKGNTNIHGTEENNYIFRRFTYNIKTPKFKSKVKVKWNIKEKQRQT